VVSRRDFRPEVDDDRADRWGPVVSVRENRRGYRFGIGLSGPWAYFLFWAEGFPIPFFIFFPFLFSFSIFLYLLYLLHLLFKLIQTSF
jgi:hypothetical protein